MVWGCITSEGPGELFVIDGYMNSVKYQKMLDVIMPSANNLLGENYLFQQDNTPCHKATATMGWFTDHDVEVLPW